MSAGLVACDGTASPPPTPSDCPTTIEELTARVFVPSCGTAGCHSAGTAIGLDLVSPGVEQRLSNVPSSICAGRVLVVPGDPEASFLVEKIEADVPECGAKMPFGGSTLDPALARCVRSWVQGLDGVPFDGGPDAAPPDGGVDAGSPCGPGFEECETSCVDTMNDLSNCGGCGRTCAAAQTCTAGSCVCTSGLDTCGDACVDLDADGANCGRCENACAAGSVCAGGMCRMGGCPPSTTDCDGGCVDTDTSSLHCGGCNTPCAAGQLCSGGSCACGGGLADCGGCVDTSSSAMHCGGCDRPCPAGQACVSSVCSCPAGQMLCGGTCIDVTSDPANCGACGRVCEVGTTCGSGMCTSCGPPATLSGNLQPIFTARCAGAMCHGGPRAAGGLSLEAGRSHANLVNRTASGCMTTRLRVRPFDAGDSYLVNKLTGEGMCFGRQMPIMGAGFSAPELDLVRSWICRGALDD